MSFQKATKSKSRLRMALIGASGSGKTYTALTLARVFGRVAVIDTEHGSASKYADDFDFDVCEPKNFSPMDYITAMHEAEAAGYAVIVIDSLSHAWMGKGGVLEIVDRATAGSRSNNKFTAGWGTGTPEHNKLIDAIVSSPCHIIATMRAKAEYVIDNGTPRKIGTAPIQRDGMEFEFDIVAYMQKTVLTVDKTRYKALEGVTVEKPGQQLGEAIKQWLSEGVERAWTNEEAAEFYRYWTGKALTQTDILKALAVTKLTEWKLSAAAAHEAVRLYVSNQTEGNHDAR